MCLPEFWAAQVSHSSGAACWALAVMFCSAWAFSTSSTSEGARTLCSSGFWTTTPSWLACCSAYCCPRWEGTPDLWECEISFDHNHGFLLEYNITGKPGWHSANSAASPRQLVGFGVVICFCLGFSFFFRVVDWDSLPLAVLGSAAVLAVHHQGGGHHLGAQAEREPVGRRAPQSCPRALRSRLLHVLPWLSWAAQNAAGTRQTQQLLVPAGCPRLWGWWSSQQLGGWDPGHSGGTALPEGALWIIASPSEWLLSDGTARINWRRFGRRFLGFLCILGSPICVCPFPVLFSYSFRRDFLLIDVVDIKHTNIKRTCLILVC